VISTSFADIFYNNCFKNGILPIKVTPEHLDKLMDDAERGANATLTIDLESRKSAVPTAARSSSTSTPFRKHCLLNGLDDIGLTLAKEGEIDTYEKKTAGTRPWAA
jgi:3-isopropylmalate/(R)-2-methylmalate dehydratase small subunit